MENKGCRTLGNNILLTPVHFQECKLQQTRGSDITDFVIMSLPVEASPSKMKL